MNFVDTGTWIMGVDGLGEDVHPGFASTTNMMDPVLGYVCDVTSDGMMNGLAAVRPDAVKIYTISHHRTSLRTFRTECPEANDEFLRFCASQAIRSCRDEIGRYGTSIIGRFMVSQQPYSGFVVHAIMYVSPIDDLRNQFPSLFERDRDRDRLVYTMQTL